MSLTIPQKNKAFFSQFTFQEFAKNSTIISGPAPAGIYFLESGLVAMYATLQNGENILHNIFKPGTFFPMMWALTAKPNRYEYRTLSNCKLYRAPKTEVMSHLSNNPEIVFDLLKRVYSGLDGILCRTEQLVEGNAYNRVVCALLILYHRFADTSDTKATIKVKINQETMANLAGTTKETFNRNFSKLKKNQFISYSNQYLVIHDYQSLVEQLGHS